VDANIYIIRINSDLFFTALNENQTYHKSNLKHNTFFIAKSIPATDTTLLMEYEQLNNLLDVVFKIRKNRIEILLAENHWLTGRESIKFWKYSR
jgi:MFS superfamily sulfate permease-like transporter